MATATGLPARSRSGFASAKAGDLERLLGFWFAPRTRARWFDSTPAFDREVAKAFGGLHRAAAAGELDDWRGSAEGCLGLVLLLDQVPRHVFRGTPRAYATDPQARAVTHHALARGFDRALDQERRAFLYMPLQHSEDPADQARSVALFAALDANPEWAEHARRHRDVIARFGRFPHRNAVLGRATTAAEATFLADHAAGW